MNPSFFTRFEKKKKITEDGLLSFFFFQRYCENTLDSLQSLLLCVIHLHHRKHQHKVQVWGGRQRKEGRKEATCGQFKHTHTHTHTQTCHLYQHSCQPGADLCENTERDGAAGPVCTESAPVIKEAPINLHR